jgi:hypothetical protein
VRDAARRGQVVFYRSIVIKHRFKMALFRKYVFFDKCHVVALFLSIGDFRSGTSCLRWSWADRGARILWGNNKRSAR